MRQVHNETSSGGSRTTPPPTGGGGTHPVALATDVSGTLAIGNGGTGQVTAQTAIDALTDASSGTADQVWTTDGTNGSWQDAAAGSGDVSGPGTSTDSAIALWNGAGGDTLKNSAVTVDGSGNIVGSPTVQSTGTGYRMYNSSTETLFQAQGVGSVVNWVIMTARATGNTPTLSATGDGTDTNISLQLLPAGTGDIELNPSGGGDSHVLTNDFYVDSGDVIVTAGDVTLADDRGILFGGGPDAQIEFVTGTFVDTLCIGTGVTGSGASGVIAIMELADFSARSNDISAAVDNPQLRVYSADADASSDFIALYHDQTNAQIGWGVGDLQIRDVSIGTSVVALGGLTLYGDTASTGDLNLRSTTHINTGHVFMGSGTGWAWKENTGFVGQGTTSPNCILHITGSTNDTSRVEVHGDGRTGKFEVYSHHTAGNAQVSQYKSRGSEASPSVLSNGDTVGLNEWLGHDGSSYQRRCQIKAVVNGSVSSGNVPMDMQLRTGSSSQVTRVTIDSAGDTTFETGDVTIDSGELHFGGPGVIDVDTTSTQMQLKINGTAFLVYGDTDNTFTLNGDGANNYTLSGTPNETPSLTWVGDNGLTDTVCTIIQHLIDKGIFK